MIKLIFPSLEEVIAINSFAKIHFAAEKISNLNYTNLNVSLILYQWSENRLYSNPTYGEYPYLWSSLSEPLLDNTVYPSFYTIANFTRYAPALGTVYTTTNDNSELVQVCTYESGQQVR